MSTARPCPFCNSVENKKSVEHIYARWLEAYVPSHTTRSHSQVRINDADERRQIERQRREMPIGTYQQTTGGICKRCNETWMNALEDHVQPTLIPILKGGHPVMTPEACTAVAAWCWKTAAMIGRLAAEPLQAVGRQEYRHLFVERLPPPTASVWVAQFAPGDAPETSESHTAWTARIVPRDLPAQSDVPYNVYAISFSVGCFAALTFGYSDADLSPLLKMPLPQPPMRRIWPSAPDAPSWTWPPSERLVAEDRRGAAHSFARALELVTGGRPERGA